jgi:hypothetical protein
LGRYREIQRDDGNIDRESRGRMTGAEKFMEDTGRSGGDSGRSFKQGDHEKIQRQPGRSKGDTERFGIGGAEKFTKDIGKSGGNTG